MTSRRPAAFAGWLVLAAAAACVDPVIPGSGIPTLDDSGIGATVAVSVGGEHSCALTTSGDAYCWGSNEFGQLGVAPGNTVCAREDRRIPCEPRPQLVSGGLKFLRIAAGGGHTCAVAVDGHIYCWGDNQYGQLGDPAAPAASAPRAALTAAQFTDVVAGDAHTCGLRTDGVFMCWGSNDLGQLGVATAGTGSTVPVAGLTNLRFASLSAGMKRTCGRVADGASYCWGAQWVFRGADDTEITRSQAQPERVPLAPAFSRLSVGGMTTCGLALDGTAWCWEANPTGAIGDGSTLGATEPQQVKSDVRFTSIAAGSRFVCGVGDTGDAYCWGSNRNGQLAVSPGLVPGRCGRHAEPCAPSPQRASGWRTYRAIAAGLGDHACGLTIGGNVYCWGAGSMGQRGDGTAASLWSPTRVALP